MSKNDNKQIDKIYKFRPLASESDLGRIKDIINNGFWCDQFYNLNDPMEGLFTFHGDDFVLNNIFTKKQSYKICSFSGTLDNNLLWGYYANGFKGVALEVEVDGNSNIKPVEYIQIEDLYQNSQNLTTEEILLRKTTEWEHEQEYRSLIRTNNNKHRIGRIKRVITGDPYSNVENKDELYKFSRELCKFSCLKNKLIRFLENKNIRVESYSPNPPRNLV